MASEYDRREFEAALRPTRAIVDLGAISTNIRTIKASIGPTVDLMAVVKANAYGHGARFVAKTALAAGATDLGVATVDEGTILRRAAISAPILVLGPIDQSEYPSLLANNLSPTIARLDQLDNLLSALPRLDAVAPVHIKLDTGMRRYGGSHDEVMAIARRVAAHPALHLAGLSTHFAEADSEDLTRTDEQLRQFQHLVEQLGAEGIEAERCHVANSAAVFASPRYHRDMVRSGIAIYGLQPSPAIALPPPMRPAMRLVSQIARIIQLLPGDRIGYGGTHLVTAHAQAALVPVGYADGYRRGLSNQSWMSIRGVPAPVLGRISMDQTVVHLPNQFHLRPGEPVMVFGADEAPSADDLATMLDTINYEVVTGIAVRVPRVYLNGEEYVGVERLSG